MAILKVMTVDHKMPVGDANPFLVNCEDGNQYIAKTQNRTCNGKGLFNELVAARIAKYLGLPIPNYEIGKISKHLQETSPELQEFEVKHGHCFLSKFTPGTAVMTPVSLKFAQNQADFPGIILFDELIMNTDRGDNKGNWYIARKTRKLTIIDHERIFEHQQIWDPGSLTSVMTNPPHMITALDDPAYQLLVNQFGSGPNPFSPLGRKISAISDKKIIEFTSNIPEDWNMSTEDIVAVTDFIRFQISHVDDIIKQLEVKFKTRKGA